MKNMLPPKKRAATYREIAYKLWRLSLDQRKNVAFELRSHVARIAEDLERFAGRVERQNRQVTERRAANAS